MGSERQPTSETGPYSVKLHGTGGFKLRRHGTGGSKPGPPQPVEQLLIDPAEVPALRAALFYVWAQPHYYEQRWDVARSWLTTGPPQSYTPDQIADANAPWQVTRSGAAIVIEGPLWSPAVYEDGSLDADIEYARLEELIAALAEF